MGCHLPIDFHIFQDGWNHQPDYVIYRWDINGIWISVQTFGGPEMWDVWDVDEEMSWSFYSTNLVSLGASMSGM